MFRDLRYASRMLSRSPGWTAVVVLSLAIGIGANTALFTAVNGLLLRTLSVDDPDTLVRFRWAGRNDMLINMSDYGNTSTEGGLNVRPVFSYPMFEEFRKNTSSLAELMAGAPVRLNAVAEGQAELVTGYLATGNLHALLGIRAEIGRTLMPDDDKPGAPPVAVISNAYWRRRFGMDPAVVGKVVRANNTPVTIVGVIEPRFTGVQRAYGPTPDITLPLILDTSLTAGNQNMGANAPPRLTRPTSWWIQIMGRLKPGVSSQQVEASLDGVFQQTARQGMEQLAASMSPDVRAKLNLENRTRIPRLRVTSGARGIYDAEGEVMLISMILAAVVTLILLIVCANVANLTLSRATARQREIAIRLSIGATRWKVIQQLLIESVLLACVGGAVGLLVAVWTKDLLPQGIDAPIDWHVLSFALALSCMTGIIFGILPAIRATASTAGDALKENSRTVAGSRSILGKSLLVVQVAVSLVLLVGAGLFLRTVANLRSVDVAFNPENLLLFDVNPRLNRYDDDRIVRLYADITERLQGVGGARAVTASNNGLMSGNYRGSEMLIEGRVVERREQPTRDDIDLLGVGVAPNFFATMGIPMVLGRDFTPRDSRNAPRVAVINEAAARKFFPNQNPIGQRFGHDPANTSEIEIVGVARDTKYNQLREAAPAILYEPLAQGPQEAITFALRTEGDPVAMMPLIRDVVRQVDPNLAVLEMTTQKQEIEQKFAQERLLAQAYSAFAAIALFLASIGLFALMSYNVSRRTNEIGIRIALGAQRVDVLRMVMSEYTVVLAIGFGIGLAASLAAGRLIRSVLFGITATDPLSIGVATATFVIVALIAAYLPARRASRIEPLEALRYE